MFVRPSPLTSPVSTVTGAASVGASPGTNIPVKPPVETGDRSCDDTTSVPCGAGLVKSTAPRELGVAKRLTQMSSKAFASRGASWKDCAAPLNRYTAVTASTSVYDVLKTRTSDTNGTPPTPATDAATGSVTVSARRAGARRKRNRPAVDSRELVFIMSIYVRAHGEHSRL